MYTYYGCYQFVIEIDSTVSVQIALMLEYMDWSLIIDSLFHSLNF